MDLITIKKPKNYMVSYEKNYKSIKTEKNSDKIIDKASISEDAKTSCDFLKRLEGSAEKGKNFSIEKYKAEYEKIREEIESGSYGEDKKRYRKLLDDAFKNAINSKEKEIKAFTKESSKIKMNSSSLLSCQKQYEKATSLLWIFKAENKRILEEIEYYRRKKNHRMVASLSQLSNSYKHVINNIGDTASFIRNSINDSISSEDEKKVVLENYDGEITK